MKTRRLFPLAAAMSLTLIAFGANARAQTTRIPILNPSFENDVVADGTVSTSRPTGWQAVNFGQPFLTANPTQGVGGDFPSNVPDGSNAAYIYCPSSITIVYQTLTTTLAANTLYTLTLYVGASANATFGAAYQVTLGVDGFGGNTLIASNSPGQTYIPVPSGTFVPITLVYDSRNGSQSLIGHPLTILFSETENGNGPGTAYIDNVTLTAGPVPEPSTWALLAMGALVFGGVAWKRRRRLITLR